MWVYVRRNVYNANDELEKQYFITGFYGPDGTWHNDLSFTTLEEASARVSFLNGGAQPSS